MPFFIPSRLIDYEYYENGPVDNEYVELAKPYQYDIGFAFFAVNLGYSLSDYEQLTPLQRALIIKELELKEVKEDTRIRNAVLNAIGNANRKKNSPFRHLWKKKQNFAKVDVEELKIQIDVINNMEKENGKSWVDKIYAINGIERIKNG